MVTAHKPALDSWPTILWVVLGRMTEVVIPLNFFCICIFPWSFYLPRNIREKSFLFLQSKQGAASLMVNELSIPHSSSCCRGYRCHRWWSGVVQGASVRTCTTETARAFCCVVITWSSTAWPLRQCPLLCSLVLGTECLQTKDFLKIPASFHCLSILHSEPLKHYKYYSR